MRFMCSIRFRRWKKANRKIEAKHERVSDEKISNNTAEALREWWSSYPHTHTLPHSVSLSLVPLPVVIKTEIDECHDSNSAATSVEIILILYEGFNSFIICVTQVERFVKLTHSQRLGTREREREWREKFHFFFCNVNHLVLLLLLWSTHSSESDAKSAYIYSIHTKHSTCRRYVAN